MLRVGNFRRGYIDRAFEAVGLKGLVPHELRHTAASLAIGSGARVKGVQLMLGHASATMTVDLYGHLFPGEREGVALGLDEAARAAEDLLRTSPGSSVRPLGRRVPKRPLSSECVRRPRQDSNLRRTV
jgi:hypothetical protein